MLTIGFGRGAAVRGLALFGACMADAPRALEAGAEGRLSFVSDDAYDFPDMIAGRAPERVVHGDLSLPAARPVEGAAILSHGAGGVGARQRRYVEILNRLGYATFLLDHFGPRGVGGTTRDQLRVTAQTMARDVFAARDLLAGHPAIPADGIGVIGWSKGGVAAVISAVDRLAGYAAGGPERLAFAVAFYPFCGFDLDEETLATPLLMLLGGEDDWTPAGPCVRQAEAWRAEGAPARYELYAGARHGFDSGAGLVESGSAVTVRDASARCLLRVGPDGATRTLDGRHEVTTPAARRRYLRACGVRGVSFAGDADARARADAAVRRFLEGLGR